MKNIKDLLEEFKYRAIDYHTFGIACDYKRGNKNAKGINKIYDEIKKQGKQEDLLQLIYSESPEVSSLAAVYCLRYNPEKCLQVLKRISEDNIPIISMEVTYAIQNWNNNEWGED